MKTNNKGYIDFEAWLLVLIIGLMIAPIGLNLLLGIGGLGPTRTHTILVQRLYTSSEDKSSHYMVATSDGQVFEVNNGLFLGVWNADEIYGSLKEGGTYRITTEGNKVVNFFFQHYPYITHVHALE